MMVGEYIFHGFTTSTLLKELGTSNIWKLELRTNSKFYAETIADDLPLGQKTFHFSVTNETMTLNLNSCDDSFEYNCADGGCIQIVNGYHI